MEETRSTHDDPRREAIQIPSDQLDDGNTQTETVVAPMIYQVAVSCAGVCLRDESVVITGDAEPVFVALGLGPEDLAEKNGPSLLAMIQEAICTIVDERAAFSDVEILEDWENGVDIVLGFFIVIRDSILAHLNAGGIPTVVTVLTQ